MVYDTKVLFQAFFVVKKVKYFFKFKTLATNNFTSFIRFLKWSARQGKYLTFFKINIYLHFYFVLIIL